MSTAPYTLPRFLLRITPTTFQYFDAATSHPQSVLYTYTRRDDVFGTGTGPNFRIIELTASTLVLDQGDAPNPNTGNYTITRTNFTR
ncbi:hypothetical protein [Hymenobacter sp. CRA2]|uniref:hypothetical protein n=1 Tax=Hymenobacter sp. CRA2 TaxID=1955620 RepID=UPI001116F7C2|nr:hypothetical protein [Hymenobacter sp. CRA2]